MTPKKEGNGILKRLSIIVGFVLIVFASGSATGIAIYQSGENSKDVKGLDGRMDKVEQAIIKLATNQENITKIIERMQDQ